MTSILCPSAPHSTFPTRYTEDILALIPTRSNSNSIPDMNVRDFCGKPLLAHSVDQAQLCSLV